MSHPTVYAPSDPLDALRGLTSGEVALFLRIPSRSTMYLPSGMSLRACRERELMRELAARGLILGIEEGSAGAPQQLKVDASICTTQRGEQARALFVSAAGKLGWRGIGTPPKQLVALVLGAPSAQERVLDPGHEPSPQPVREAPRR